MCSRKAIGRARSAVAACRRRSWPKLRPGLVYVSLCAFSHVGPWASRRGFDTVVQNVSGITTRQGELFPGKEPGPQFYPVSAIDYLTGYLMAFGAMVALARRAREGGSWLVRISLAQTGKLAGRPRRGAGERAQGRARRVHRSRNSTRWSIESTTPAGKLRHLGPTVQLSETPPRLGAAIGAARLQRAGMAGPPVTEVPQRATRRRKPKPALSPDALIAGTSKRGRIRLSEKRAPRKPLWR